jgi:hypothetical protein
MPAANELPAEVEPIPESRFEQPSDRRAVYERYCASLSITNLLVAVVQLTELDKAPGHEKRRDAISKSLKDYEEVHRAYVCADATEAGII